MSIYTQCNLHTHTDRSDGDNTAEQVIQEAISRGMKTIGFSDHSHTPGYEEGSLPVNLDSYTEENRRLKEKYSGFIEVVSGIEEEFDFWQEHDGLDYHIGSRHSNQTPNGECTIDDTPERFQKELQICYGGDAMKCIRDYYSHYAADVEKHRPEIIGHFDLVRKFNAGGRFFDEDCAKYRKMALEAAEAAGAYGAVFEVNTSNMARKRRPIFYPADFILRFLLEKGYPVILSSDAHSKELINGCFDEAAERLKSIGFKELMVWKNGAFAPISIK